MKATLNNLATYESPRTEVLNIAPEGVLCGSANECGHNGFNNGGDLDFSDWNN